MITAADIRNIQALPQEDQALVFNLVDSLLKGNGVKTDAQRWFHETRDNMVNENPLTMEEIDMIIHEEQG